MLDRKRILIIFCCVMVGSALLSAILRMQADSSGEGRMGITERGFSPRQHRPPQVHAARAFSDAVADAVERVMPSVVVIHTIGIEEQLKRDLFGFPLFRYRQQVAGEGSGVIVDAGGHVLTSLHLLQGVYEEHIHVMLNDGRTLPAKMVGYDQYTDLAVLQIESEGEIFPFIEMGDSDAVRVGEVAIAIGSPFSLYSSVTVGHVSQKGRQIEILPYEDFIQTDAAINEGNSGGPLIDVDGRLIGINTAIKTDAVQRGVGIAFAVPSNLAAVIARSLTEKGEHEWPWVGAFFGGKEVLKNGEGVPVRQVWNDTPAAEAGLQPGDIILKIKGTRVRTERDIYRIIFNHSVGETLSFTALRDQETELTFDLRLEEFPGQP